jgi:hypothetical protein
MNLREKKQPQGYSYASSYHTQIGCQFNPKSYPAVLHGYKGFSLREKANKETVAIQILNEWNTLFMIHQFQVISSQILL